MARINLLPWRETERKERQKQFGLQLVVAVVLAAGSVLYWHVLMADQITYQQKRNGLLKAEIAKVNKKIVDIKDIEAKRAKLVARMNVIQGLQISRPQIVHLFDEIVETIPDGAYLDSLEQQRRKVMLHGWTQSNARISSYMRNIDDSGWLGNARLKIIESKAKSGKGKKQFKLVTKQVNPKKKAKAKAKAKAEAEARAKAEAEAEAEGEK